MSFVGRWRHTLAAFAVTLTAFVAAVVSVGWTL